MITRGEMSHLQGLARLGLFSRLAAKHEVEAGNDAETRRTPFEHRFGCSEEAYTVLSQRRENGLAAEDVGD